MRYPYHYPTAGRPSPALPLFFFRDANLVSVRTSVLGLGGITNLFRCNVVLLTNYYTNDVTSSRFINTMQMFRAFSQTRLVMLCQDKIE